MESSNKAINVLIVDDDPSFCSSLADVLNAMGYEAVAEIDPRNVLETLRDGKLDIVLVDLMMPYISGLELIPLIRQAHPSLPIIVVSANRTDINTVMAKQCGASEVMTKPVDFEFLEMHLLRACHIEDTRPRQRQCP